MFRFLFILFLLAAFAVSHEPRGLAFQYRNGKDAETQPTRADSSQKPSSVKIKVFAQKIGQFLPSAVTITSRLTNRFKRYTLPNGQLEETYTQPDQFDILVSAPGYVSVNRQLTVELSPTGKTYEFDVVLDPVFSVTVRGIDKWTLEPIPGIRFTLTGADLSTPIVLTPNPATGFATANLPHAGTYRLSSTAIGYSDFSKEWVAEKDHSEVTFKLVPLPTTAAKDTSAAPTPVAVRTKPVVNAPVATTTTTAPTKPPTDAVVASNAAPKPVSPARAVPKPVAQLPVVSKPVAASSGPAAPTHFAPTHEFEVIEKGKPVRLEKLYFDQSSPILRPDSRTELDQLYNLLTQHPVLRIEVRGHTDNQGDFDANVRLSRERCQAVVDYLVGKGIASDRLKAVGRGPIDPVAPNNNEENRKKNRRVEFVVM